MHKGRKLGRLAAGMASMALVAPDGTAGLWGDMAARWDLAGRVRASGVGARRPLWLAVALYRVADRLFVRPYRSCWWADP